MDKALGKEEIVSIVGLNGGNTPPIPLDGDGAAKVGKVEAAV